jgi:hypothetical protein
VLGRGVFEQKFEYRTNHLVLSTFLLSCPNAGVSGRIIQNHNYLHCFILRSMPEKLVVPLDSPEGAHCRGISVALISRINSLNCRQLRRTCIE